MSGGIVTRIVGDRPRPGARSRLTCFGAFRAIGCGVHKYNLPHLKLDVTQPTHRRRNDAVKRSGAITSLPRHCELQIGSRIVRQHGEAERSARMFVSTPGQNLTLPPVENLTDRRGDEPQAVATS